MKTSRNAVSWLILKAVLAGALFVLGSIITGMIAAAAHITIPMIGPAPASPQAAILRFLLACTMMTLLLAPVARGIRGAHVTRLVILTFFLFICLAINMVIEMLIFTTFFINGGSGTLVASLILPAMLCSLLLARIGEPEPGEPALIDSVGHFFAARSVSDWSWRFLLAILAFPFAYFLFGMMVAPFVTDYYLHGNLGLTIPPLSVIARTQILRSALFLLASLPIIILWKRSRGSLILSLGLAHWVVVGLFGLVQTLLFPPVLRIAHSLEIGGDSFLYAALLTCLLFPRPSEQTVSSAAPVAHQLPS